MSIEVSNLVKTYGSQRAVNNISFTVGRGEILGFLGPNGAGKSTTMKIATTYIPPTEGCVKVCGYDVTRQPMEVRKRIGYLPEHNPLYLDMYVEEYLNFIASLHHMRGTHKTARLSAMVETCGLQLEKKKKIGALSKGYRQRVGLAQALIHDPEVLILDEPTTGLDPNQILEIREVIKEVGKEKTVLFSTHILQEVQAICKRVVIISKGTIVADSSVENLKQANNNLKKLAVEFETDVPIALLQQLPGAGAVVALGGGKYELEISNAADARPIIVRLAAEQNLPLVGLRQEETSLESIFKELTKNHTPH